MARTKVTEGQPERSLREKRNPGESSKRKSASDDDDDDFVEGPQTKRISKTQERKKPKTRQSNEAGGSCLLIERPKRIKERQEIEIVKKRKGASNSKTIVVASDPNPQPLAQVSKLGVVKKLQFRCTTRLLHETISKFNNAKKEAVLVMGFGAVMECRIRDIPTELAHWCVSNYNGRSGSLDLMNGKRLNIDEEDVFLTLGLPRGAIKMTRNPKLAASIIGREWERRLGRPHKKVRQRDVIDALLAEETGGDWFKLNFIIFIECCLIEAASDGYVRPKILDNVEQLSNVHNLNWCKYLLDVLILCHESYTKQSEGIFNVPVLFLVILYVDRVADVTMQVQRVFPAMKGWTSELLRKRETRDMQYGCFGEGRMEKRLEPDDNVVKNVCYGETIEEGNEDEEEIDAASFINELINDGREVTKIMTSFVEKLKRKVPKKLADNEEVRTKMESCRNLLHISDPNYDTFRTEFFASTQAQWNNDLWDKYCLEAWDLYENVEKLKKIWEAEKTGASKLNDEQLDEPYKISPEMDEAKTGEMQSHSFKMIENVDDFIGLQMEEPEAETRPAIDGSFTMTGTEDAGTNAPENREIQEKTMMNIVHGRGGDEVEELQRDESTIIIAQVLEGRGGDEVEELQRDESTTIIGQVLEANVWTMH